MTYANIQAVSTYQCTFARHSFGYYIGHCTAIPYVAVGLLRTTKKSWHDICYCTRRVLTAAATVPRILDKQFLSHGITA